MYGESLFNKLKSKFSSVILKLLLPGEKNKYFVNLEDVCENLIEQNVSKRSILIAFGGGGVGNLVGMAAGLIYRGIRFIEVPTTFTGQTDSTLSNKQAVNGRKGKNHFGLYHSPLFILADTKFLQSEPLESRRAGIIEGIKNGLIHDQDFFFYLRDVLKNGISDYEANKIYNLALNIINSKLSILKHDPSEKVYGIILEYGHTFGHAIEWLMKGKMLHGDAVSIGMRIAAELSKALGMLTQEEVDLHYDIIENRIGYNIPFPPEITTEDLMKAMINDNKKTGRELRFILLEKIGKCHNPEGDYLVTVNLELVSKVVDSYIKSKR